MARKRQPPYIKKAGQRGRVAIWLVDGAFIRTTRDIEFNNFAQHSDFDFIPLNEFWIDQEAAPDELAFYVEHMAVERRELGRGKPAEEAGAAGQKAEQALRIQAGDVKKLTAGGRLPDPAKVHVRLWKKLESGVSVWIINGRLVRSVFDIDYTSGGHEHVYEFIPQDEVWIDNDLSEAERAYTLLHELHERNLMAAGWTYSKAHASSNKLEVRCRKHPTQMHGALGEEGWE